MLPLFPCLWPKTVKTKRTIGWMGLIEKSDWISLIWLNSLWAKKHWWYVKGKWKPWTDLWSSLNFIIQGSWHINYSFPVFVNCQKYIFFALHHIITYLIIQTFWPSDWWSLVINAMITEVANRISYEFASTRYKDFNIFGARKFKYTKSKFQIRFKKVRRLRDFQDDSCVSNIFFPKLSD